MLQQTKVEDSKLITPCPVCKNLSWIKLLAPRRFKSTQNCHLNHLSHKHAHIHIGTVFSCWSSSLIPPPTPSSILTILTTSIEIRKFAYFAMISARLIISQILNTHDKCYIASITQYFFRRLPTFAKPKLTCSWCCVKPWHWQKKKRKKEEISIWKSEETNGILFLLLLAAQRLKMGVAGDTKQKTITHI